MASPLTLVVTSRFSNYMGWLMRFRFSSSLFLSVCLGVLFLSSACNYQRSKVPLIGPKPTANPASFSRIQNDLLVGGVCNKCHGPGGKSGLELFRYENIIQFVEPGKPKQSRFYDVLASEEMPPGNRPKVKGELLESIEKWIADGAKND